MNAGVRTSTALVLAIAVIVAVATLLRDDDAEAVSIAATKPDVEPTAIADGAARFDVLEEADRQAEPSHRRRGHSVEITGTVVLSDGTGVLSAAPNGEIYVANRNRVFVVDGSFQAEIADFADKKFFDVKFFDGRLDGLPVRIEQPAHGIPMPSDRKFSLTAIPWVKTVLHVRDAMTGAELKNVIVQFAWPDEQQLPRPTHRVLPSGIITNGPSPVTLVDDKLQSGVTDLFVRSMGYAPRRIAVDAAHGGERVVALSRAGTLEVAVQSPAELHDVRIRLRENGQETVYAETTPDPRGSARIEDLQPGKYRLTAEFGERQIPMAAADEAWVDIRGGELTRAVFDLSPLPGPPPKFRRDLVVSVPDAWNVERLEVFFSMLDPQLYGNANFDSLWIRREQGSDAQDRASASIELRAGRHVVHVNKVDWMTVVDLPAAESTIRIDVPPPSRVVLRLVDAATGRDPGPIDGIEWRACSDSELDREHLLLWSKGLLGIGNGEVEFDAAAGPIEVAVIDPEFAPRRTWITAVPGRSEHVLELKRRCAIDLTVKDGGAVIPASEFGAVTCRRIDGDGNLLRQEAVDAARRLTFSEPGRWLVTVPVIPGYLPLPPQEVNVIGTGVTPMDVALVRRP